MHIRGREIQRLPLPLGQEGGQLRGRVPLQPNRRGRSDDNDNDSDNDNDNGYDNDTTTTTNNNNNNDNHHTNNASNTKNNSSNTNIRTESPRTLRPWRTSRLLHRDGFVFVDVAVHSLGGHTGLGGQTGDGYTGDGGVFVDYTFAFIIRAVLCASWSGRYTAE